jgi:tetratricopeptide (TPR) repeat protein
MDPRKPGFSSKRMTHIRSLAMAILLALFLPSARLLPAQAIDPFYLKLFQDGEAAFRAQDYAKAVKDLEVAVFGLSADRTKAAKAYIYLSLSHNALKNKDKSRQFLVRAAGLVGKEGPGSLGLDMAALNGYERLIEDFRITPGAPEEQTGVVWDKAVAEPPAQKTRHPVDPSRVRELEARLKASPDEAAIRYELGSLYFEQGTYKRVVGIMEGILKKRPEEVSAVFHLARARFFQREFRKANDGFHKVISPSSENQITKDMVLRSTIYLTICLHELGQKESLASYLDYISQNIPLAELKRILVDEGLTERWALLKTRNTSAG